MDWFLSLPIFHLPWWAYVAYCCSVVVAWFVLYGLEAYLNSGSLGRHPVWFPFQCAWEELRWYLPEGKRRRVQFIQERVSLARSGPVTITGTIIGRTRAWRYEDVLREQTFLACADDVLPGPFHLLALSLAAALWPLALCVLIVGSIIAAMVPKNRHPVSS